MNSTSWNNYLAITWDKYLPPIRPYFEELSIFKTYIQRYIKMYNAKPKVLILGSTPELRDVVYEYEITPTVVDFSKENYEGMSLLRRLKGSDTFIKKNWLDLNDCDGQFDFIFSEAAFNVLPKESSKKIYQIISKLLTAQGIVVAKEWIRFSDKPLSIEHIIEEYRSSTNSYGFYSFTCIPLMLNLYDYENDRITLRSLDKGAQKMLSEGKINQQEYDTIGIHDYQNVELELYIPKIDEFEQDVNEYLDLIAIHNVNIAHSEFHPIFVLERKDKNA